MKKKIKETKSPEKANSKISVLELLNMGLQNIVNSGYKISKYDVIASEKDKQEFQNYHSSQYCPDQYIGSKKELYNIKAFCKPQPPEKNEKSEKNQKQSDDSKWTEKYLKRINAEEICKSKNIVILILESPHKNEFDRSDEFDKRYPSGPALGTTGQNIVKYFRTIFGNKFDESHLLLMNAINYQCSLGISPHRSSIYRDTIFSLLWEQEKFQEHFKVRLNNAISKGIKENIVIINACTEGNFVDEKLWKKVQYTINDLFEEIAGSIPYCHIGHPACWNLQCNNYKNMIGGIPSAKESTDSLLQSETLVFNKAFQNLFSENE